MRFQWLANRINKNASGLTYELYKPWRHYQSVIFLKSMSPNAMRIASRLKSGGTTILFDLNVDYVTPRTGRFHYDGMAPTLKQRCAATLMTTMSTGVIADSRYLEAQAGALNSRVRWVPDNVELSMIPSWGHSRREKKLTLFWSGEAVKAFELLRLEAVLRKFTQHIRIVLITGAPAAWKQWYGDARERLINLLACVDHEICEFRSLADLFKIYSNGGVIISPRYMDNSYNYGHSEWKIALGMANGRMALCSPIPSYLDLAEQAGGSGIRICRTDEQWMTALSDVLTGKTDLFTEEAAAREVIEKAYSTEVISKIHAEFVRDCIRGQN